MAGEINTQTVIDNLLPDLHSDTRAHLNFWAEADLIQWIDEAVKRLARKSMMFVQRDATITTVPGTATYTIPAWHLATVHASYGAPSCVQGLFFQTNPVYVHSVTVGATSYSVLEASLTAAQIATNIAGQINASDPSCTALTGGTLGNEVTVTMRNGVAGPVTVQSTDGAASAIISAPVPLRPSNQMELEARDPAFATTAGAPNHWYEDLVGLRTIGVAPVPVAAVALPLIYSAWPQEVDVAKSNILVQAPAPVKGYLAFSVLAQAYGRESESEMPDVAQHAAARVAFYEEIFTRYYGPGM